MLAPLLRPMIGLAVIIVFVAPRPTAAPAADPKITWRTDYNAARKESEETGLPLLLQIGSEDCFYCKKMEATTYRDAAVITMLGSYIPLKLDGNKEATLAKQLKVQLYPTTVLAGADGTIHAFVQGYVGIDAFKDQLKRTTDLVAADVKTGRELLDTVAAMKTGDYAKAVPVLQRLVVVTKGKSQEAKVKELLAEAEKVGGERLTKANLLVASGKTEEALRALNDVSKAFTGTTAAAKAESQLLALGGTRLDRNAIALRAVWLMSAARDLSRAGAYSESLDICTLLDSTTEAKAAAALSHEIRSDATRLATMARQANEKAASLQLALGDAHTAKGDTDEAKRCYELAIRLAPNKAEQVQVQLAKLRGEVPSVPAVRQK